MTAKVGLKIDLGVVAELVKGLQDDSQGVEVLSVAGVVRAVRLKHSELGSGFVFKGSFSGWRGDEGLTTETLTLPIDLGLKIAKACKAAGKNPVRFSVRISAKKSAVMAQGYSLSQSWGTEPEEVGQMDIVKEMLLKLKE